MSLAPVSFPQRAVLVAERKEWQRAAGGEGPVTFRRVRADADDDGPQLHELFVSVPETHACFVQTGVPSIG